MKPVHERLVHVAVGHHGRTNDHRDAANLLRKIVRHVAIRDDCWLSVFLPSPHGHVVPVKRTKISSFQILKPID
jgi:hypothetical protein